MDESLIVGEYVQEAEVSSDTGHEALAARLAEILTKGLNLTLDLKEDHTYTMTVSAFAEQGAWTCQEGTLILEPFTSGDPAYFAFEEPGLLIERTSDGSKTPRRYRRQH
jgi:hypothetical protein